MNKNKQLNETLIFSINKVSVILRKFISTMLIESEFNINYEEFLILLNLYEIKQCSQSKMSKKILKSRARVTRILDALIIKGYIEKKVFENDKRNFILYLTSEGKLIISEILPLINKSINISLQNTSTNDLNITLKTLLKIYNNLDNLNL